MSDRWLCEECDWIGKRDDLLSAPDPFNEGCMLYACPTCRLMTISRACDVDGCKFLASCGEPTENGYVFTCSRHAPGAEVDK